MVFIAIFLSLCIAIFPVMAIIEFCDLKLFSAVKSPAILILPAVAIECRVIGLKEPVGKDHISL
jgi:hypothetical protein